MRRRSPLSRPAAIGRKVRPPSASSRCDSQTATSRGCKTPFATSAELTLENTSQRDVSLAFSIAGTPSVAAGKVGHLHVQRRETLGPTLASEHIAAEATGLGRLAGDPTIVEQLRTIAYLYTE